MALSNVSSNLGKLYHFCRVVNSVNGKGSTQFRWGGKICLNLMEVEAKQSRHGQKVNLANPYLMTETWLQLMKQYFLALDDINYLEATQQLDQ